MKIEMHEEGDVKKSRIPTVIGFMISLVWVLICVSIFLIFDFEAGRPTLNQIGDFIAGMTAPLFFVWIIVGYYRQGVEIKQNTKALLHQAKELEATKDIHTRNLALDLGKIKPLFEYSSETINHVKFNDGRIRTVIKIDIKNFSSNTAHNVRMKFKVGYNTSVERVALYEIKDDYVGREKVYPMVPNLKPGDAISFTVWVLNQWMPDYQELIDISMRLISEDFLGNESSIDISETIIGFIRTRWY